MRVNLSQEIGSENIGIENRKVIIEKNVQRFGIKSFTIRVIENNYD